MLCLAALGQNAPSINRIGNYGDSVTVIPSLSDFNARLFPYSALPNAPVALIEISLNVLLFFGCGNLS